LDDGDKVKLTVLFRGRENAHPEIGRGLLDQLADLLRSHGIIEQSPRLEGKTMTMLLAPLKQKVSAQEREGTNHREEAEVKNA
jgi:translation initiation factor IF-3